MATTDLSHHTFEQPPILTPFGLSTKALERATDSTHKKKFSSCTQSSPAQRKLLPRTPLPHLYKNTLTMANYLASIFGTEADKVNCSFYYKIGACRHGDRCSRKHVKPSYSQTILLPNLYQNPAYDPKNKMNASQLQNHFDAFYEDFWCEMCKFGEIEEVVVCDNNNEYVSPSFLSPLHISLKAIFPLLLII